ncbi:MAG: MFS transporter [Anaerolineae bacterium]|nr:MFS transporter [Anaerolineae bacterium]
MNTQHNLRTFYTLILTQTFSHIGSRMTALALGIYVYNQTGEATPLALVALFSFLPQALISSVAGVLADRWDRRYVMILSDAGQAVGTLVLLGTFLTGNFSLPLLYAITLIQAVFGVFQGPAFQASMTMLIPDSQRDRANAIQQLTGPVAGVIAPAIAGVLYAAVGVEGVILFDMITFVAAVIVVLLVHIPHPEQTEVGKAMQGSFLKETLGGFRFLLERRTLFAVMIVMSLVNFLFSGASILFTPYLLARTGSEATMGLLLAVLDLGAIVGAVAIGVLGSGKYRTHIVMLGIMFGSVLLSVIGVSRTPLTLGVALFLMTLPMPAVNAIFASIMQAKTPPDIQGRVFASIGQVSMLLIPLSYLVVGPLSDQVFEPAVGTAGWERVAPLVGDSAGAGMGLIMVIAGGIVFAITGLIYAVPRVRSLERDLPDYTPEEQGAATTGEYAAVAD